MSITIVLVDDHDIVRAGLRAILDTEKDFQIVGEASDGQTALQIVQHLKPDILLLDLVLPKLNGLDVARSVHNISPGTQVIVLSMHSNEAYVVDALKIGVAGYVLKDKATEEILEAIRYVLEGERYLSPPISGRVIESYIQRIQESSMDSYETLSDREREVFTLAAEGHSNPEIAQMLSISPRTVETHRSNVMRKLGLRTQTDLIRYAYTAGHHPVIPE
jgi:two-component system, NarL family, response regulator NreC